ncbi:MAG: NADH-quinone oxidoreductase subunit C [Solirubrobacterales bacterium]
MNGEITRGSLPEALHKMKEQQTRFVTMTCVDLIDQFELIYSFDREMELEHLRVKADKDRPFPSITGTFPCAFLIENEIQDQFGLRFEGLKPDFEGLLMLAQDGPKTPMLRSTAPHEVNKDAV